MEKNIPDIEQVFNTLLFSWGSDTPQESIWAANELMQFYLKKSNIIFLNEDFEENEYNIFIQQLKDI